MFHLTPSGQKKDQPLARLRSEFEALLDQFLGQWPAPFDAEYGLDSLWGLEVEDRENEIVVRAEAPGFEPNELNVEVRGGILIIKAEKKPERQNGGNGHGDERSSRSFQRKVKLPDSIDRDKIEAKSHNGVLEIHLPKREEAKPKRIAVQG